MTIEKSDIEDTLRRFKAAQEKLKAQEDERQKVNTRISIHQSKRDEAKSYAEENFGVSDVDALNGMIEKRHGSNLTALDKLEADIAAQAELLREANAKLEAIEL